MAFDHSFSVLYTHLGENRAEALTESMMCGDSSEIVCDGKACIWLCEWAKKPLRLQ